MTIYGERLYGVLLQDRGRLRTTLLWGLLVFIALLPICLLSFFAYRTASASISELVRANNQSAAAITAELVSHDLERSISLARAVAALPGVIEAVERHDEQAVRERLRPVVESYGQLDRAFVTDSAGVLWSDFPRATDVMGKNFSNRDWYRGMSGNWQPYVSAAYQRLATPQLLVVAVAVPIRDAKQQPIGALVCQYRLENVTDWLRQIRLGRGGYVFVIDHAGTLVAHPRLDLQARLYDDYGKLDAVQDALRGHASVLTYLDPLGHSEMIASVLPVTFGSQRWAVIAQQPLAEANAPVRRLAFNIGIAACILAAGAVWVVVWLGRTSDRNSRLNVQLELQNLRLQRLASIVESSDDAIMSHTLDGIIVSWNRGAQRMLGYSVEEVRGRPISILVPTERVYETLRVFERLRVGEPLEHYETQWVRHDGRFVDVSLTMSPIRDFAGKLSGVSCIARDITENKRDEERLAAQAVELARSNAELQQFAYVASHDLQEPLRMIASYTQLLARRYKHKLDAEADSFVEYAVNGAHRMQRLINDLLQYARVGAGPKPVEPVATEAVLAATLANLTVAIKESRAVITHDDLPLVGGNLTELVQLFQNLVGNALKFRGSEPPRIHVSAERDKEMWRFSVRDNGIGIDPQYFERIFIIFQRLHAAAQYPGTGIGLALCKKIVEWHDGRIWVESEPGKGSVFYFTLPVVNGKEPLA